MRALFQKFDKNLLLKITSFNSIHVVIRMVTGAIMSWVIANFVGAAGMGIMGNLRNFVQGVQSVTVLGLENGIVKSAAQFKDNKTKLETTIATGWALTFIATGVLIVVILFAAPWLDAVLIASDYSFVTLFRVFALTLPFWVGFVFISSMLQGFAHYKKYITLNIIVGLVAFSISVLLMYEFNLIGALYSIILTPVIQFVIACIYWKITLGSIPLKSLFAFKIEKEVARLLMQFSIMALVSAILIPFVNILVRDHLRLEQGDEAAGWWEAMVRISGYYMMFVTSLISLYVLPKLSANDTTSNYRATISQFYKTILPVVFVGLIGVFLIKDYLIAFLFSAEFEPTTALFKWQLIGDFIKIITTVLAFRFIAVNDLKRYLIAEFISVLCFYVCAKICITSYGVEGVVQAHVITYVVYLIALLVLLREELFTKTAR